MKELSFEEMNNISGAYGDNFWANLGEAFASATLGAAYGFAIGASIGGKHGGDGGGLLGIGAIGQLVGMLGAGIIGAVTQGVTGVVLGLENTTEKANNFVDGLLSGIFVP